MAYGATPDDIITAATEVATHHGVFQMFLQMLAKEARPVEALAAHRARVRLAAGVQRGVVAEGRRRGEDLAAHGAGVGVARVRALVLRAACGRGEALGAKRAGVRALARVHALVL